MSGIAEDGFVIPPTERELREQERIDRVLAHPQWTLMQIGWEVEPGRVQGQTYYRIGDGLGPCGRDDTPRSVLRRAVMWHSRPDQPWGIRVLAVPVERSADGE